MNLKWIDTHTHLEHEYPFDTDEYLKQAKAIGVQRFITIGTRPNTFSLLKNFAEKYEEVYFTVGVHPHEAKDWNETVENEMSLLQTHPKCVGVGEIGLDYYYSHSSKEEQKTAFAKQLSLALEWKKPVVIHARDAEEDLLTDLVPYAAKAGKNPGIIHCFSGSRFFAEETLKLGFYISFSGILTFKKADELRHIASIIPLDRLLIETDSPFLAPVPYRGKPNQSAYMIETAKQLAAIKKISLEKLSEILWDNSKQAFKNISA